MVIMKKKLYDSILLYHRYVWRKRTGSYTKDDPLGVETEGDITTEGGRDTKKPGSSVANMSAFDNPVYDSTTLTPAEVDLVGYETKPEIPGDDDKPQLKPDLDEYQLTGEVMKQNDEFDLNSYDAEDVYHDDGEAPALYEYGKL